MFLRRTSCTWHITLLVHICVLLPVRSDLLLRTSTTGDDQADCAQAPCATLARALSIPAQVRAGSMKSLNNSLIQPGEHVRIVVDKGKYVITDTIVLTAANVTIEGTTDSTALVFVYRTLSTGNVWTSLR